MKYPVIKIVFIIVLLWIPLMAVDCCRTRDNGKEFKISLAFQDTSNSQYKILNSDSVKLRVLDAPNPDAADSFIGDYKNMYYKRFFLNPNDTISRAELQYRGKKDTVTVQYHKGKVSYEYCSNSYNMFIEVSRIEATSHWLFDQSGTIKLVYPQGPTRTLYYSAREFMLYYKE